ncbi:MAG: aminoglycoside adenylyltransferase domain-containing protein [Streptosporangiaceae bacterium]
MQYSVPARPLGSLPESAGTAARALHAGLAAAFGADLCALYLYGAVVFPETFAASDGEPAVDLDYHVILTCCPSAAQRAALTEHAAEMARCHPHYGRDLDGWFILLADARRAAPPGHLLRPELRDFAWPLHRAHWLAGRCVILHGPDPAQIVRPPDVAELRTALNHELDFAARDHSDAYAVLNACRIIHSVALDDVVQSKFGSAAWALEHLRAEHHPAILAALASYQGRATEADRKALAAGRPALITLAARELGR